MNRRIVLCFIGVGALILGANELTAPSTVRGQGKGSSAQKIKILREKLKEAQALIDAIESEVSQLQQTRTGPPGLIKALQIDVKLREQATQDRIMGFGVLIRVDEKNQEEVITLVRIHKLALRNVVCARVSKISSNKLSEARGQEKLREIIKTAFDEILFAGHETSLIRQVIIEDFKFQ